MEALPSQHRVKVSLGTVHSSPHCTAELSPGLLCSCSSLPFAAKEMSKSSQHVGKSLSLFDSGNVPKVMAQLHQECWERTCEQRGGEEGQAELLIPTSISSPIERAQCSQ